MDKTNIPENAMILAQDRYYSLDCIETQLNNNVLVVGPSGAGKTRSIVSPNILQAIGSYLIVDPKGNLYGKYAQYLRKHGYEVRKLNFADPEDPQTCSYNFFRYIHSEQDVLKIAHMLIKSGYVNGMTNHQDPFWDDAAELLLIALIGHLSFHMPPAKRTLPNLLQMLSFCDPSAFYCGDKTNLDRVFDSAESEYGHDFSVSAYRLFRQAADRTLQSILITVSSKLAAFNTKELQKLFSRNTVPVAEMGNRKTALFVVVSDTDRCMDPMANLFFTQAMNELVRIADGTKTQMLPIPVRFLLDDFATNVSISEFPRMIASIRSRNISVMLMIQAESQLTKAFGDDGRTVVGNCDTYVFLGTNDPATAKSVAERANVPLGEMLYMPVGTNWIFRRGQRPVYSENFKLEPFADEKMRDQKVMSSRG